MTLKDLEKKLHGSWSSETSYYPELWTEGNKAFGQCSVTSLIVQDYFGGEIVYCKVTQPDGKQIAHYYNIVEDEVIDLTRSQFLPGSKFSESKSKTEGFASTREFMLSGGRTQERYELLKRRLQIHISR